ncbi:MAG: RidA family protein [Candidatus Promineifilaceae bacterium]|jgi:2-iminobutanoate/2-iminopropanoate deaminase
MINFIDLNEPDSGHTYSSCTTAGGFIFTSHIGGFTNDQGCVLEGVAAQTVQCFNNLEQILAAAGATLNDVLKVTVYLRDPRDFEEMREVYRGVFSNGYPARMTATSRFVDPRCRIQIEAIAYKP